MSYCRSMAMRIEENTMSVKLQPSMTQNTRELNICGDYWAYNNQGDYIAHVKSVCQKYDISSHILFQTVGECFDNLGIPYNMQHADYVVGGQPKLVS